MFREHVASIDELVAAALFISAFVVAGVGQTLWLRSSVFHRFALPIDGGLRLRGRPLFGPNKTLAGLFGMTFACGLAFALVGGLFVAAGGARLVQIVLPRGALEWLVVGTVVGLVYMLGELPNSFVKRQLGIEPGTLPASRWGRRLAYAVDQSDSVVTASLFCAAVSPLGLTFVVATTVAGVTIHACFNALLKMLGLKERAG